MKAIINPKVKKHLPYILIVCIAASFLVLFVDYRYAEKYSDFVNVDAVIADVTRETTYHGESQKMSYDILITYEYSYDGKDYMSNRRELTKIGKKTGKQVSIKCNPESPEEIQEVYKRNIFALITSLLLLWDFFLWKGMQGITKKNKKMQNSFSNFDFLSILNAQQKNKKKWR